jgi:hypothetical protein
MKVFRAALIVAFPALSVVAASTVDAQLYNWQKQSEAAWKRMDDCKRQAWKENRDYTPQGNAKRDEAVKQCLQTYMAPPASPLEPRESTGSSQR